MAPATSRATGSSPAAAQAWRYDTPRPVRAGSPPLAAAKACQAWLTQAITPSRSSSATSTPTSGRGRTLRPGEAPAIRLRRLPLAWRASPVRAALPAGDRAAAAASTEG